MTLDWINYWQRWLASKHLTSFHLITALLLSFVFLFVTSRWIAQWYLNTLGLKKQIKQINQRLSQIEQSLFILHQQFENKKNGHYLNLEDLSNKTACKTSKILKSKLSDDQVFDSIEGSQPQRDQ